MKYLFNSIFSIAILSFICLQSNAQAVGKGSSVISFGYGFPNWGKSIYNAFSTNTDFSIKGVGPLHLKYEYMLSDKGGIALSINFVSFGATFKDIVLDSSANSIPTSYTLSTKNYSFIARYNYHFFTDANIDVYWGLGLGFRGGSTKVTSVPFDPTFKGVKTQIPLGFESGFGLRYFFTDNFGAYTEIGLGKSLIQFGACYKL